MKKKPGSFLPRHSRIFRTEGISLYRLISSSSQFKCLFLKKHSYKWGIESSRLLAPQCSTTMHIVGHRVGRADSPQWWRRRFARTQNQLSPNFLHDLLARSTELARKIACNRSIPLLFIYSGLRPIETSTIESIINYISFLPLHKD